jgi:LAO/AO transport system kinase
MASSGEHAQIRREQQVKWMWSMLDERVFGRLKSDQRLRAQLPAIETAVAEGRLAATLAVEQIAALIGI